MVQSVVAACQVGTLMVYLRHNLIAFWTGEVGENPTLTRNRELFSTFMFERGKSDYHPKGFFTTRRGLRGGNFFRRRELLFVMKGSHVSK
jgi:hypothetical protein